MILPEASWVLRVCEIAHVCVCVCTHAHARVILLELSALSPTAGRDLSVRPWWGSVKLNSMSLYQLRCNSDTNTACGLQRQRLMTAQRLLSSYGHRVSWITFRRQTRTGEEKNTGWNFLFALTLENLLCYLERKLMFLAAKYKSWHGRTII